MRIKSVMPRPARQDVQRESLNPRQALTVARRAAETELARLDLPLERDMPDRGRAQDLHARLAELPSSHPSSDGYVSDKPAHRPDNAHGDNPADYAVAGDIRLTADRRVHILDGDKTGGGHRHGTGMPDKTEFPKDWDDDQIIDAVLAVARNPDQAPKRQDRNDSWLVSGKHDDVEIVAIVKSDGLVWTAWPREGSPGVVKNALKDI
jgi:hypothetical protein